MTLRPFNINDAPTILSWCKDKHAFRLWSADRYKDFPARRDIGTGPCFDRQVFHKLALRSEEYHHLFCAYAVKDNEKSPETIFFWHKKLLVSKIIPIFAQSL